MKFLIDWKWFDFNYNEKINLLEIFYWLQKICSACYVAVLLSIIPLETGAELGLCKTGITQHIGKWERGPVVPTKLEVPLRSYCLLRLCCVIFPKVGL